MENHNTKSLNYIKNRKIIIKWDINRNCKSYFCYGLISALNLNKSYYEAIEIMQDHIKEFLCLVNQLCLNWLNTFFILYMINL